MKKSLDDGSSNVVAERNIAKGIFQPDFERHQPSFVDISCTAFSHLAGDSIYVLTSGPHLQWHQRGWRRCLMISHVGLLPKLSQSEWIWNRVILTRHQSPVIQSFSLQSRSPKELEVQDRFVRTEMTRKSRWYKVFLRKAEVLWGSRQVFAECYEKVSGWRHSNTFAQKKQLAKQHILADFEQLSNVDTFLAEDYECSEILPIDTALCHLAGDLVRVLRNGASAIAPAWLEKMRNDFSGRSAAKAESKWQDLE